AEMPPHGARPERCAALLGPVICGRCYEVSRAMPAAVARAGPAAPCTTGPSTPGVDIRAASTAQLKHLGGANITHDARCTRESPDLFSYRRESTTGRFAGYVWRVP